MWFTNVVKPTHRCNLACTYCYNEDTRNPVMPDDVLQRTISETFDYAFALSAATKVDFIWHGGEPTAVGLPFYRRVIELQKASNRDLKYANSIQTNGTLLNAEWISFLKENSFDVSLSLDGPEHVHNITRRYRSGRGSFDKVMAGIELLRSAGIPHGVCVVVSHANKEYVDDIFDFLAREKLPFNVIPLTRSGDALEGFADLGLGPQEYAEPWIRLFDRWFDSQGERYVQCTDFVRKARAILIGRPTDCIGQRQCASHHISTDPDGFVYPCATLSGDPEWVYGNLGRTSLSDIMRTPRAQAAAQRSVDPHCAECKWQHVCHGGCMSRSIKFYGTHNTRDYYCDSLYRIYEHIERRLRDAAGLDLSQLPPTGQIDHREPPKERPLTMRRNGFVRRSLVEPPMEATH